MRRLLVAVIILCGSIGCTFYYLQNNLNTLSPGMPKQEFLGKFVEKSNLNTTRGAIVRAAKVIGADTIEVLTLPLSSDGVNSPVEYWFVFKNARLAQWGRPEDWKSVAATYQIDFNPGPSVRPPT